MVVKSLLTWQRISMGEFLDLVSRDGKTHPKCGQYYCGGWGPGLDKQGNQAVHQHSSRPSNCKSIVSSYSCSFHHAFPITTDYVFRCEPRQTPPTFKSLVRCFVKVIKKNQYFIIAYLLMWYVNIINKYLCACSDWMSFFLQCMVFKEKHSLSIFSECRKRIPHLELPLFRQLLQLRNVIKIYTQSQDYSLLITSCEL